MSRPGVEVSLGTTSPNRGVPSDTGPAFFAGISNVGPATGYTKIQNLDQYDATFGGGVQPVGSDLRNSIDVYFREGGSTAYVARVSNAGSNTGITAPMWDTAIAQFPRQLGPGQILEPGNTTLSNQQGLLEHARLNGRVALIDGPDTAVVATVQAAANALNAHAGAKFGLFLGNRLNYSGPGGTTLVIPGSAVAAALIARNDRRNSPNVPAAGDNGIANNALGLTKEFSDVDRETLNTNGAALYSNIYGEVKLYGFRSLALLSADANWWMFSHARLFIGIQAACNRVAEGVVFDEIDGQRRRLAQFEGDLVGVLLPLYNAGSLYGSTPDEAFIVDAKSTLANPDSQLASGTVKANVGVRMSPFAELVQIPVTKVPITEKLAA